MLSATALDAASLFDRIDFSDHPTVVAAVSGGSDSTALLVLLRQYLDRDAPAARLVAVTVDHALRAGSADEARQVAAFCARIGVGHVTRTWAGAKPSTGLAAAARDARYRLLAEGAGELGATLIFLGHTADDQAETVAMRAQRGEGRGLAGMAPATLLDGRYWLMRPLLGVRRETLRDRLRGENIGWIDDPSNDNRGYERVRTRLGLEKWRDIDALLSQAEAAARRRIELGRSAAALIAAHASLAAPGLVRLTSEFLPPPRLATPSPQKGGLSHLRFDPLTGSLREPPLPRKAGERSAGRDFAPLLSPILHGGEVVRRTGEGATTLACNAPGQPMASDADTARYALRLLLAVTGGQGDLPSETATDELLAKVTAGARRAVLSRAVVDVRAGSIWLHRELRNLPELNATVEDGVWDGRFRMTSATPAGQDEQPSYPQNPEVPAALLRAAAATMPRVSAPSLRAIPIASPWARFLPSFDLAPATAILRLIGGDLPPPLPYAGHSQGQA